MKRPPAPDDFPAPTRGERPEHLAREVEELDWPDEITVKSDGGRVQSWMRSAGLSMDMVWDWPVERATAVITCQARDVWYAGIVRGYELTLRRI